MVTNLKQERGDAAAVPGLTEATRGQFRQVVGEEYAAQFINAVEQSVKVSRDDAAIRKTKGRPDRDRGAIAYLSAYSVRAELVEALPFFQRWKKGQPFDRLRANGAVGNEAQALIEAQQVHS